MTDGATERERETEERKRNQRAWNERKKKERKCVSVCIKGG